jgi:hypothetical protein
MYLMELMYDPSPSIIPLLRYSLRFHTVGFMTLYPTEIYLYYIVPVLYIGCTELGRPSSGQLSGMPIINHHPRLTCDAQRRRVKVCVFKCK